jgi:putative oxidoreductase
MIQARTAPYAALLLRVALGAMFLAHSIYLKAIVFTLPGTADFFVSIGLPGVLAYVVFAFESVGGLLLVVGYRTREIAGFLVPILIGAIWVHWPNGWLFTAPGGGWEYPAFLAAASVVLILLGDGVYSLGQHFQRVPAPAANRFTG